jgi:hypothetical protein
MIAAFVAVRTDHANKARAGTKKDSGKIANAKADNGLRVGLAV